MSCVQSAVCCMRLRLSSGARKYISMSDTFIHNKGKPTAQTSHSYSINYNTVHVLVCMDVVPSCPRGTDLCWKKVSRALQTVYLSWMVSRWSSCWLNVRPWTLMLGGRISATHCRELRAGDLTSRHRGSISIHALRSTTAADTSRVNP